MSACTDFDKPSLFHIKLLPLTPPQLVVCDPQLYSKADSRDRSYWVFTILNPVIRFESITNLISLLLCLGYLSNVIVQYGKRRLRGGGANMNTCIVIYNNPSFVGMHSRTFLSNRISINLRSRHYISHYNRCDHAAVNPVNFIVTISGIPKRSHFITNAAITKIVKMLFQIGILCARYSVPV